MGLGVGEGHEDRKLTMWLSSLRASGPQGTARAIAIWQEWHVLGPLKTSIAGMRDLGAEDRKAGQAGKEGAAQGHGAFIAHLLGKNQLHLEILSPVYEFIFYASR